MDFFKKEVASHLSSFNLEYRSYADGDLGVLEQVIFDTQNIGGNFDFWESGWLGIYRRSLKLPWNPSPSQR